MPLFKAVKKPVIKASAAAGGDISPLRPRLRSEAPPCGGACPSGTAIRAVVNHHRAGRGIWPVH